MPGSQLSTSNVALSQLNLVTQPLPHHLQSVHNTNQQAHLTQTEQLTASVERRKFVTSINDRYSSSMKVQRRSRKLPKLPAPFAAQQALARHAQPRTVSMNHNSRKASRNSYIPTSLSKQHEIQMIYGWNDVGLPSKYQGGSHRKHSVNSAR